MARNKLPEIEPDGVLDEEFVMDYLTKDEYLWCHAYLTTFNGSQAVRDVGADVYNGKKITPQAIAIKGVRWKKKPAVQAYLRYLAKNTLDEMSITRERTLREIANVAFSNVKDMLDEHGDVLPISAMSREATASIHSLDIEVMCGKSEADPDVTTKKIKLVSKQPALEMLCKYHKLLGEPLDEEKNLESAVSGAVKGALSAIYGEKTGK